MKLIENTVLRYLKQFIEIPISDIFFFIIWFLVCVPVAIEFYVLNDLWNVINFGFVIPFALTAERTLLLNLIRAFENFLERSEIDQTKLVAINNLKLASVFNHQLFIYFLIIVAVLAQFNYIIVDLGALDHKPIFLDWEKMYSNDFELIFMSKRVFFVYYLAIQFIFLIVSLISITGLIQICQFIYVNLNNKKMELIPNFPKPSYLGLEKFNKIAPKFLFLVLVIILNSATYLLNMKAVLVTNLIAFWVLVIIVLLCLFFIKIAIDNYLTFHKERYTNLLDNAIDKTDFEYDFMNIEAIKEEIFNVRIKIYAFFGVVLTLISILLSIFGQDNIQKVRIWIEEFAKNWF